MSRTLFINPWHGEWAITASAGLGYNAAVLEKIGTKVTIIDCQIERKYRDKLKDELKRRPVVGITTNISTIKSALGIASFIRKTSPETKIIMGGPHATAIYEKLMPTYADIVVLGEGESTLAELAQTNSLNAVKGIAYWDDKIKVTESRPYIMDLDTIPVPAWHLFNLKAYRYGNTKVPRVVMITSRGCTYSCVNCTKYVHGWKLRLRSVDNIMDEIDYLVQRFDMREIWVSDDNFTCYPERVKKLCEKIIQRNYKKLRFKLTNGIRADINDKEMFSLMARARFITATIGIESGSQTVLTQLGKGLVLEKVRATVENVRNAGMEVSLFFMIGLPFETPETIRETIDFAKSLKADQACFWMTIPFPGTDLYEMIKKDGRFLSDLELEGAAGYSNGKAVFETGNLKAEEIEKLYKRAHLEFYLRPGQIWRALTKKSEFPPSIRGIFSMLNFGYKMLSGGARI